MRAPESNPVPAELRICPKCGAEMTTVDHSPREILNVIPARIIVRVRLGETSRARHPLARAADGTIAVFTRSQVEESSYEHVMFPCVGGGEAALPWQDTLYATVIGQDDRGIALWQAVGAECDVPRFKRWRADRSGRQYGRGHVLGPRQCG